MTWHNREKDWYNAERRFIFSVPSKRERDQWIKLVTSVKPPRDLRAERSKKKKKNGVVQDEESRLVKALVNNCSFYSSSKASQSLLDRNAQVSTKDSLPNLKSP